MTLDKNSSLKQVLDSIEQSNNGLIYEVENLRDNLKSKEIEVEDDETLSQLINKVNLLDTSYNTFEKTFNVNVQLEEPLTKEKGDLWIKLDNVNNIYFKDSVDSIESPQENDVFIKLYDIKLKLTLDKLFNFISNKSEINIDFKSETVIDMIDIPVDKLFYNDVLSVFAKMGNIRQFIDGGWKINSVTDIWDGKRWTSFKKYDFSLLFHALEGSYPLPEEETRIKIFNQNLDIIQDIDIFKLVGFDRFTIGSLFKVLYYDGDYIYFFFYNSSDTSIWEDSYIGIYDVSKGEIVEKKLLYVEGGEFKKQYPEHWMIETIISKYTIYIHHNDLLILSIRYRSSSNGGSQYIAVAFKFSTMDFLGSYVSELIDFFSNMGATYVNDTLSPVYLGDGSYLNKNGYFDAKDLKQYTVDFSTGSHYDKEYFFYNENNLYLYAGSETSSMGTTTTQSLYPVNFNIEEKKCYLGEVIKTTNTYGGYIVSICYNPTNNTLVVFRSAVLYSGDVECNIFSIPDMKQLYKGYLKVFKSNKVFNLYNSYSFVDKEGFVYFVCNGSELEYNSAKQYIIMKINDKGEVIKKVIHNPKGDGKDSKYDYNSVVLGTSNPVNLNYLSEWS